MKKSKSFRKRHMHYKILERHNDNAMGHLTSLLDFAKLSPDRIVGQFRSALSEIDLMVMQYTMMAECNPVTFRREIARIAEAALPFIHGAVLSRRSGASDSEVIRSGYRDRVYHAVCELSDAVRDNPTLGETRTLHDVVRFIHEIARNKLFDFSNFNFEGLSERPLMFYVPSHSRLDSSSYFKVVDLGGAFNPGHPFNKSGYDAYYDKILCHDPSYINCLPLRAMVEFYIHSGRFTYGEEEYTGVADSSSFTAEVKLGEHFSEFRGTINPASSRHELHFKYRDTKGYTTSRERAIIFQRIAQRLGYTAEKRDNIVVGDYITTSRTKAYQTARQTARLFASMRDVDQMDYHVMETHINKAVNKFFKGCVNLYRFMERMDYRL